MKGIEIKIPSVIKTLLSFYLLTFVGFILIWFFNLHEKTEFVRTLIISLSLLCFLLYFYKYYIDGVKNQFIILSALILLLLMYGLDMWNYAVYLIYNKKVESPYIVLIYETLIYIVLPLTIYHIAKEKIKTDVVFVINIVLFLLQTIILEEAISSILKTIVPLIVTQSTIIYSSILMMNIFAYVYSAILIWIIYSIKKSIENKVEIKRYISTAVFWLYVLSSLIIYIFSKSDSVSKNTVSKYIFVFFAYTMFLSTIIYIGKNINVKKIRLNANKSIFRLIILLFLYYSFHLVFTTVEYYGGDISKMISELSINNLWTFSALMLTVIYNYVKKKLFKG